MSKYNQHDIYDEDDDSQLRSFHSCKRKTSEKPQNQVEKADDINPYNQEEHQFTNKFLNSKIQANKSQKYEKINKSSQKKQKIKRDKNKKKKQISEAELKPENQEKSQKINNKKLIKIEPLQNEKLGYINKPKQSLFQIGQSIVHTQQKSNRYNYHQKSSKDTLTTTSKQTQTLAIVKCKIEQMYIHPVSKQIIFKILNQNGSSLISKQTLQLLCPIAIINFYQTKILNIQSQTEKKINFEKIIEQEYKKSKLRRKLF